VARVTGTQGNDDLYGTQGDDLIHALAGNDRVLADEILRDDLAAPTSSTPGSVTIRSTPSAATTGSTARTGATR
jgi:RTX calcium-binding nonapeptide repeat (4 copies)